jgi:hypothetical protein
LEKWYQAGASSDLKKQGADLATKISTFFRFIATPLALKYGGGESGLARFLKDASARIAADPKALFGQDERSFIDKVLGEAWRDRQRGAGASSAPLRNKTAWDGSTASMASARWIPLTI